MFFRSLFLGFSLSSAALAAPAPELSRTVTHRYADLVYETYRDTLKETQALDRAIAVLLAQPSDGTLQAARLAWTAAHLKYSLTEAFRFYDGPIDGGEGVEGFVNSWPVDESYIDYVAGAPQSGIINQTDKYTKIDADALQGLHEVGGDTNVATGYHAIEFLLWGQDQSTTGPGARPVSDYLKLELPSVARRHAYLRAASQLLVKQMQIVVRAWDPQGTANYSARFRREDPASALTKIFKGITYLMVDEVAGERMYTAYESQSQEDEQSCFSDNTAGDLVADLQGVVNVFTGTYAGVDGPGLEDLLVPALSKRISSELKGALSALDALPKPFDSLIVAPEGSEERKLFLEAIFSVQDAGNSLKDAAAKLELKLPEKP